MKRARAIARAGSDDATSTPSPRGASSLQNANGDAASRSHRQVSTDSALGCRVRWSELPIGCDRRQRNRELGFCESGAKTAPLSPAEWEELRGREGALEEALRPKALGVAEGLFVAEDKGHRDFAGQPWLRLDQEVARAKKRGEPVAESDAGFLGVPAGSPPGCFRGLCPTSPTATDLPRPSRRS
jgi:hypothetical protein